MEDPQGGSAAAFGNGLVSGWLPAEPDADLPPTSEDEADQTLVDADGYPVPPPYLIWPENWPALTTWCELDSQWRTDQGVRTGLDYSAVVDHLNFTVADPEERRQRYADLRLMESPAIGEYAANAQAALDEIKRQQQPKA